MAKTIINVDKRKTIPNQIKAVIDFLDEKSLDFFEKAKSQTPYSPDHMTGVFFSDAAYELKHVLEMIS